MIPPAVKLGAMSPPTDLPSAPPGRPRSAVALGCIGALGEELLAALVADPQYATVHVAVSKPIGSAAARFRPWRVGDGVIVADDAYVCIADPATRVGPASPMFRVDRDNVTAAAGIARDCGATRLVLVAPLAAVLQLNAATQALSSAAEVEIAGMGFASLVVVRPSAEAATAARGWLPRAVSTLTRMVLDIMLPQPVQPLRAQTAALAILAGARRAGPGVHVLGARDLAAIVAETMPDALPKRTRLR